MSNEGNQNENNRRRKRRKTITIPDDITQDRRPRICQGCQWLSGNISRGFDRIFELARNESSDAIDQLRMLPVVVRRHVQGFSDKDISNSQRREEHEAVIDHTVRQITAACASERSPEFADREALVPEQNAQVCLSRSQGLLLNLWRPEEAVNR